MIIFIPVKNMARELRRAVRSVAMQSSDDWRLLILVDKASDEATYKVARDMRSRLGPSKVIARRSAKPGLYAMYDEAIRSAPADIVGILDADDELAPHAVSRISQVFRLHSATEFVWTKHRVSPGGADGLSKALPKGKVLAEALLDKWWGCSHWKVFRKSTYLKSPLPLLDVPCATDMNLACTLAATEPKCAFVNKVCYIYHKEAKNRETLTRWREQCNQARRIRKRFVGWWYKRK